MTVGLTDLLDLAISPQIGPVNFFHLRNLLHTLLDHFDIGEVEAQQAEIKHPAGYSSSEASSSSESSDESEDEDEESSSEESGGEGEVEEKEVEKEVTKTVIGDDGEEKTITVTETVTVSVPKPKVKKEKEGGKEGGEEKKKHKDKDKSKNKDEKKDRKKSKHEKEGDLKGEDENDEKKSKKKDKEKDKKNKSGYGSYGKEDKKKKDKLSLEDIGDAPQIINLTRRIDAAEAGIKSLRNIIDSMVNQVDFGDDVGNLLKDQLAQVQNQLNAVQLVPETEPKKEKKKKTSKSKDVNEVPALGIITEGAPMTNAPGTQLSGLAPSTVPVIPAVIPAVIPPKAGQTASRKANAKAGVPIKGQDTRPPSQDGKPPLRKRTTMQDLKLRKMAREEGLTIEEVEAREAKKEQQNKKKNDENQEDEKNGKKDAEKKDKEKKDEDAENTSDEESMDSEEEREAMEEMLREEIEAALENTDDPEAQAYALRLGLEQMSNMKKNVQTVQEEIRKDMDKNKRAIEQITKELIAFRAARKAQDAEGFNAVHHVHSMVLELQAKHEKVISTTSELVNEYNRREKTMEELFGHVDRLDQNKADKTNVSKEIDVKADKMELESKVSLNQFDETFNLLDQGLNEALEKMGNQMTLEEALKETLSELQNKMNMKLDRDDLDSLREQLESRIREVQMSRVMVKEVKEEGEPAGFRRNTEKVHCISCDRPLEVQPGNVGTNGPKIQGLPPHKSGKPYTTYELEHIRQNNKLYASKKAVIGADLGYHAQKLKNDVVAMTGVTDLVDLPPSQRYCGGSHTIMHPFRRSFKSTSSHFNQYVVVREDEQTTVGLPRRDFIVPKSEAQHRRYSKTKPLPAIGQSNTREPSPPMDYERFGDRPVSAPATPSVGAHRPVGRVSRVSPPQGGSSPVSPSLGLERPGSSPVEVDTISVTIPTPVAENEPN